MKRAVWITLALVVAVGATSAALSQQQQNALTAIDTVATPNQLGSAFNGQPLPGLATIAQDGSADIGMRLRAIHALTFYCPLRNDGTGNQVQMCEAGDTVLEALIQNVTAGAGARVGTDLLLLRASVESLGKVGQHDPRPYPLVLQLLGHASRDMRATAAHALGDLGDCDAELPLRQRFQQESSDQVKLAISDALRALAACP